MDASGEMPYYVKTSSGCEIYSDDRKLRIIVSRVKFADEIHYNVTYYARFGERWEKGNNGRYIDVLDNYLSELCKSPSFHKAAREIKENLLTDIPPSLKGY